MNFFVPPALRQEKKQKSFLNRRSQRVTVLKSHRRHVDLRCLNRDQRRTKRSSIPTRPLVLESSRRRSRLPWTGETRRLPTTFKGRGRRATTTTIRKQASIHSPHLDSLPSLPIVLVLRRRPSSSISLARARHEFASSSPVSFLRGNAFSQQHQRSRHLRWFVNVFYKFIHSSDDWERCRHRA